MRSEDEQIEAILGPDVGAWIASQLPQGITMQQRGFADFISVTAAQVQAFALRRGVPLGHFWMPGHAPTHKNDRTVLEPDESGWKVYYTERGEISDLRKFASFESALTDAIGQLMRDLWVRLNHRMWHAQGIVPPFPKLPET